MGSAAWCLTSFLKGDPPASLSITQPMIPALISTLLRTDTEKVIGDIMMGLSVFLSEADDSHISLLINEPGFLQKILELLNHSN